MRVWVISVLKPITLGLVIIGVMTLAGSFLLTNDVPIDPGQTAALNGQINQVQQTMPEPASMLLLGSGLFGVVGLLRRKLKTRNN